jgi:site-specific DNA-methyltransferase (adenine-specific)
MELNKIHNIDFLDNTLPDKCAQLIIADPPYYKTKGDFDFIWKTFEDYLSDVEKWALECKRLLADNGTILWYGHALKIAYSQIILDRHFELINSLVWEKSDSQTIKGIEQIRMFAPVTERILMYGQCADNYHNFIRKCLNPVQEYLKTIISMNDLADLFLNNGFCKNKSSAIQNARACLINKTGKPQMITERQYNLIPNREKKEYEALRQEYEALRQEYEVLRRPFNNHMRLLDVMKFSQASHVSSNYDHDTVKPEPLTRALILTCSRPNDLVLVPFSGSGTECAMAAKENRNFIGFDIEKKYVEMGNKRCVEYLRTQSIF